jgi:hypothetical protein
MSGSATTRPRSKPEGCWRACRMLVAVASAGPASHRPMPVITWRCHASGHPTGESRVAAAATAAPTPHSRGRLVPWRTAITPGAIQEHALGPSTSSPEGGDAHAGHHDHHRRQPHRQPRVAAHRGQHRLSHVPGSRAGTADQEASFFTVVVWRGQAEHAAQSLTNGSRVVVVGRVVQRASTAEEGSARTLVEVVAESWGRACGRHRAEPSITRITLYRA